MKSPPFFDSLLVEFKEPQEHRKKGASEEAPLYCGFEIFELQARHNRDGSSRDVVIRGGG